MKCQGIINVVKDCIYTANWKAIGYTAQFGVPSISYVCDDCKNYMKAHYRPKIMEYNRFKLTFEEVESKND